MNECETQFEGSSRNLIERLNLLDDVQRGMVQQAIDFENVLLQSRTIATPFFDDVSCIPVISNRMIWLRGHDTALPQVFQSGIYIAPTIYAFLTSPTELPETGSSANTIAQFLDVSTRDRTFTSSASYSLIQKFTEKPDKLANTQAVYDAFGLGFSVDYDALSSDSFLDTEPKILRHLIDTVRIVNDSGLIQSENEDETIPPITGYKLHDIMNSHYAKSKAHYASLHQRGIDILNQSDVINTDLVPGIRKVIEYQIEKDPKARTLRLEAATLDAIVAWSSERELLTENCELLNQEGAQKILDDLRICSNYINKSEQPRQIIQSIISLLRSNNLHHDIQGIHEVASKPDIVKEMVELYKQHVNDRVVSDNPADWLTDWIDIMKFSRRTRMLSLSFVRHHKHRYYGGHSGIRLSDFLTLVEKMADIQQIEQTVVNNISQQYPNVAPEMLLHLVQKTHFGVAEQIFQHKLSTKEYEVLRKMIEYPEWVDQIVGSDQEYWFELRDFLSIEDELNHSWQRIPGEQYPEKTDGLTLESAVDRILSTEVRSDTPFLPIEGCVIGTDQIENNTLFFIREDEKIVAYCKITSQYQDQVRQHIFENGYEVVDFFCQINHNKTQLIRYNYSDNGYQLKKGVSTVQFYSPERLTLRAAQNTLRIEMPDTLLKDEIISELKGVMDAIGLGKETVFPPTDEAEQDFKRKRFRWMHHRNPDDDEREALYRSEVFPGYHTLIDPDFFKRNREIPHETLIYHATISPSTAASILSDGLNSEYLAMRRGFVFLDISFKPFDDMSSGYSDSVGVRFHHIDTISPGEAPINSEMGSIVLVLSPRLLQRTDWHWHNSGQEMLEYWWTEINEDERISADDSLKKLKTQSDRSNEAVFRNGISQKEIQAIIVRDERTKRTLLSELKKLSIDTIGTKQIEEMIVVAGAWDDFIDQYTQRTHEAIKNEVQAELSDMLRNTTDYSPARVIRLLRENTILAGYFDTVLEGWTLHDEPEQYTLEQHTGMVLTNFERIRPTYDSSVLSVEALRLAFLIHDLGKGMCRNKGISTAHHHHYNNELASVITSYVTIPETEKKMVQRLVSQDILGQFLQNQITVQEGQEQIRRDAEKVGISVFDYLALLKTYTLCDIAAYTQEARYIDETGTEHHGKLSLDHLITSSDESLSFKHDIEAKLDILV